MKGMILTISLLMSAGVMAKSFTNDKITCNVAISKSDTNSRYRDRIVENKTNEIRIKSIREESKILEVEMDNESVFKFNKKKIRKVKVTEKNHYYENTIRGGFLVKPMTISIKDFLTFLDKHTTLPDSVETLAKKATTERGAKLDSIDYSYFKLSPEWNDDINFCRTGNILCLGKNYNQRQSQFHTIYFGDDYDHLTINMGLHCKLN